MTLLRFAACLVPIFSIAACTVEEAEDDESPNGANQPSAYTSLRNDDPIGLTSDSGTAATKALAWPNPPVGDFATLDELVTGCAATLVCISGAPSVVLSDLENCYDLAAIWEEREVAVSNTGVRASYTLRGAAHAGGACEKDPDPDEHENIVCQEIGCYWSGANPIPTVTCAGTIATLTTGANVIARDCAAAYATCDETSPTGCTDRQPVACDHPAGDVCDGTVKLGCDGTGHVSYHECAWNGGTCGADSTGKIGCIPPAATCDDGAAPSCDGDVLTGCFQGQTVHLDCSQARLTCGATGCVAKS